MTKLCVAGLPICVESADKAFFGQRFAEYIREDDREPVMSMSTTRLDVVPCPEGEIIQHIENAVVLRLADGRYCRYVTTPGGRLCYAIYYTSNYNRVDIQLLAKQHHPEFSQTDWEYVHTGGMFHNRLIRLGGGVLHSSALAFHGQGIAFSANSGVGKSTHAGLWREVYGDKVLMVNDDKPAVWVDGDTPMIAGTPWSGKTALNHNVQVPLRAIVFLERGQENRIRRLSPLEAFSKLVEQIARPYYDASLGEGAVNLAEKLLNAVPVYGLQCTVSRKAVETVYREIFSQEDAK